MSENFEHNGFNGEAWGEEVEISKEVAPEEQQSWEVETPREAAFFPTLSEKKEISLDDLPKFEDIDLGFMTQISKAMPNDARKKESENKIEIDLDQVDPSAAADMLRAKLSSLENKAKVAQYLKEHDFKEVRYKSVPLNIEDLEKKREELDRIIVELEKNGDLNKDPIFLEKLYKLKDIHELVTDAIQKKAATKESTDIKVRAFHVVLEYRKQVVDYLRQKIETMDADDDLKENYRQLVLSHSETKAKHQKAMQILEMLKKSLEEYFVSLENVSVFDTEFIDAAVEGVQALVDEKQRLMDEGAALREEIERLKEMSEDSERDHGEVQSDEENQAVGLAVLEEMKESLHKAELEEKTLQDKIDELNKEIERLNLTNQELDDENEALRERCDTLTKENEHLKSRGGMVMSAADEGDSSDLAIEEAPSAQNNKSKWKKFALIFAGLVVSILVLAVAYGYFTLQEEAPAPAPRYETPASAQAPKPEPKPSAKEEATTPVPKPTETPAIKEESVVNDVKVEEKPAYDFNKELSAAELAEQNFVIMGTGTIKVNDREFSANEIVNGHKFIKATSDGRMLFITPNNTPEWIGGN